MFSIIAKTTRKNKIIRRSVIKPALDRYLEITCKKIKLCFKREITPSPYIHVHNRYSVKNNVFQNIVKIAT